MNRKAFVPTINDTTLESRLALTGVTRTALVHTLGAPTDPSIPFVFAPPGVSQNAINFTTLRASQVLHGFNVRGGSGLGRSGFVPGIYRAFSIFNRDGNTTRLNVNLSILAVQIPFGRQELLPLWQDDVTTSLSSGEAQQRVLQDYTSYLQDNVGVTFNYLISRFHRNELGIPTNGSVGR